MRHLLRATLLSVLAALAASGQSGTCVRNAVTLNCASTTDPTQVLTLDPLEPGAIKWVSPVPVGGIMMILSGTCPAGYAEAIELNGLTIVGTLAANGDVGTTGGSDTITPSGSINAQAFTGNSMAGHSHTFTGVGLSTHSHGVGTYAASTPNFTGVALGTHSHGAGTFSAAAQTFTGSAGTVPAQTFTGSAGTIPAETITWPLGVPSAANESAHTHSVTAAGTNGTGAVSGTSGAEAAHTHNVTAAGTNGTGAVSGTSGTEASHTHGAGTLADATQTTATHLFSILTTGSGGFAATHTGSTGAGTSHSHGAGTFSAAAETFTGSAVTSGAGSSHSHGAGTFVAAAGTFTGSAVTSGAGSAHTHTISWPVGVPTNSTASFTPAGTNGTASFTPAGTNASSSVSGTSAAVSAGTPAGTNDAPVLSGSSAAISAGTPAGTLDSVSAGTPSGSVQQATFTGNAADNRSAFVKVIFCKKT